MLKGRAETDSQKKEILDKLLEAWKKSPLQRLGQLIDNALYADRKELKKNLFYIEDQDFIELVDKFVHNCTLPAAHFAHDCDSCIYLGQDSEHDFYFCNSRLPTVIARYSSNAPDYASGLQAAIEIEKFDPKVEHPLVKALKLARQRGLIPAIMTPENRKIFQDKLTEAIEKHLASGGTIIRGSFGWYSDSCCPLTCAMDEQVEMDFCCSKENINIFEIAINARDLWSFVFGVDNNEEGFGRLFSGQVADQDMYQMGQEFGRKYCDTEKGK
jgi:hypothetical protein